MEIAKFKISTYNSEDCCSEELKLNGKCIYEVRDLAQDCPEDAIIGRGLLSAHDYYKAVLLGYELGKKQAILECEIEVQEDFI